MKRPSGWLKEASLKSMVLALYCIESHIYLTPAIAVKWIVYVTKEMKCAQCARNVIESPIMIAY